MSNHNIPLIKESTLIDKSTVMGNNSKGRSILRTNIPLVVIGEPQISTSILDLMKEISGNEKLDTLPLLERTGKG